jgi:hypothetical protein
MAKISSVLSLWEPKDEEERQLRTVAQGALEELRKLIAG